MAFFCTRDAVGAEGYRTLSLEPGLGVQLRAIIPPLPRYHHFDISYTYGLLHNDAGSHLKFLFGHVAVAGVCEEFIPLPLACAVSTANKILSTIRVQSYITRTPTEQAGLQVHHSAVAGNSISHAQIYANNFPGRLINL